MIDELYDRLAKVGFGKEDLWKYALPDWWCDEFEREYPDSAAFYLAAYTSNLTNIKIGDMLTEGKALTFVSNTHTRTQMVMRDRCSAGETVEELMVDYGMDEYTVERLLGFC